MITSPSLLLANRYTAAHPEHEQRDLCSALDGLDLSTLNLDADPTEAHAPLHDARIGPEGAAIIGGGKVLKHVKGMGTVYDWRGTSWSAANGGKTHPVIFIQHIPVFPNMPGIADFVGLRGVLVAQGLMVQNATDGSGNVALYTAMDRLCYQARGANQLSCGTEHMHRTVDEPWPRVQLNASAWLVNQARMKHSIPAGMAHLEPGANHTVRVTRKGQTSHRQEAIAAGYFDRIDPGGGYDWEYVYHAGIYYRAHGHFANA